MAQKGGSLEGRAWGSHAKVSKGAVESGSSGRLEPSLEGMPQVVELDARPRVHSLPPPAAASADDANAVDGSGELPFGYSPLPLLPLAIARSLQAGTLSGAMSSLHHTHRDVMANPNPDPISSTLALTLSLTLTIRT